MLLDQFCQTSVEPMGEKSDHVHIMALSDALGVPIRVVYLDHCSCDAKGVSITRHDIIPTVGVAQNTSKSNSDCMKPFITLLYHSCPGHYDVLYPKQSDSLVKPKRLDRNSSGYEEVEKENTEDVDQRNLYLAKEGAIRKGSPAAEGVSLSDMVKRQALEKKKNVRLQSPDFYVSRTRLVVYNFPNTISEKRLKKIFEDAVLSGVSEQTPIIQKIKILGQTKNAEAIKNYPRGIALVEFAEHQHALVALRVLNNNAETFGPEHRPIVVFDLDNIRTLRPGQKKLDYGRPADTESLPGLTTTQRASSVSLT
ncbi:hypothetical protein MKW92_040457 [Papaver armeniacum]|nr:hypothetical protein MKW92_040457 [Papaver armeniacum]